MKIGKWRISFYFLKPFERMHKIHFWRFRLYILHLGCTDLSGNIIICNFRILWEKMFK